MRHIIVVLTEREEAALERALAENKAAPRVVYVAGVSDANALALALNGKGDVVVLSDPTYNDVIRFEAVRRIGSERDMPFEDLMAHAKKIAEEMNERS